MEAVGDLVGAVEVDRIDDEFGRSEKWDASDKTLGQRARDVLTALDTTPDLAQLRQGDGASQFRVAPTALSSGASKD